MPPIALTVNGRRHTFDGDPTTPLLYVLSDDLGLRGPKFGCGLGQCGACTVIVRGQAIRSCVTPVRLMAGAEITTLEGLGTVDKPHTIQQAFVDEQAAQCGFCLNAIIMTAKAFLDRQPHATDEEIRGAFSNVLCRCFTHTRLMKAIDRYKRGLGSSAAHDEAAVAYRSHGRAGTDPADLSRRSGEAAKAEEVGR